MSDSENERCGRCGSNHVDEDYSFPDEPGVMYCSGCFEDLEIRRRQEEKPVRGPTARAKTIQARSPDKKICRYGKACHCRTAEHLSLYIHA
jgi:hypothetical protein